MRFAERIGRLSPGLVDSGASSLATFAAGVVATRLFTPTELGTYALFFSAWALALQVPSQGIFVPAEARLVKQPVSERSQFLGSNAVTSIPLSIAGSSLIFAVLLFTPTEVDQAFAWELAVTTALVSVLFPIQDHARRLLHLSRSHWAAASASVARLVVALALLWAGMGGMLNLGLVPFGSLAAGDLAALVVAAAFCGRRTTGQKPYSLTDLLQSGKWLLLSATFGPASGVLVSVLVTHLASAADLGLAEAARVAAQPVLVFAVGLSAVLRPESMEAAIAGDQLRSRSLSRRLFILLAGATLLLLIVVSLPEGINPLRALIPVAFEEVGLVQLSVVAALLNGAVFLERSELTAVDKVKALSIAEAISGSGRSAVALLADVLRSWSVPISFLVGGLLRLITMRRSLRRHYSDQPTPESA